MRFKKIITAILVLCSLYSTAQYVQPMGYKDYSFPFQVNIGNGAEKATHTSAYLEIGPTGTGAKGFLPPRLSQAQRDAIASPATWLTILNTSSGKWNTYNGSSWVEPSVGISTLGNGSCLIKVNDSTYRVDTSCVLTKWQFQKTTDSLVLLISMKLDRTDTTYNRGDSLFKKRSNVEVFLGKLNGSGGGGSGIELLGNSGNTCLTRINDSTYAVDTVCVATRLRLKHVQDSVDAALNLKANQSALVDTAAAIRADFPTGGGGSGAIPADSLMKFGLRFYIQKVHNVVTTRYYSSDINYKNFFHQAWVKPMITFDSSAWLGYIMSTGYGGGHMLLWGVSVTAGSNGTWHITGNISYNGTPYTFSSPIEIPINTTHHVAVGYNGTRIVMYVDGVPVGYLAYTGFRNEVSGTDGKLYIGGSDHLNLEGIIYKYQAYEFHCPIPNTASFFPKRSFINSVGSTGNWDFTKPTEGTIPDISDGHLGLTHDGQRNSVVPYIGNPFGSAEWANTGADARPDSMLPQYVKDPMTLPVYPGSITSAPSGALAYDFFERTDITPASTWNPRLDTTQGGTLGRLPYTTRLNNAGILSGLAWFDANTSNLNWSNIDVSTSDQDIRVTLLSASPDKLPFVQGRYTDENNRVYLFTYIDGNSYLYKVVAGVTTQIGSTFTTGNPTTVRLVISGSTCDVIYDGVTKISGADISGVPLGTKCGFGTGSNYTYTESWEVH